MKIVIVCDLLSTFLRFRRFLAKKMRDDGFEVCVITSVIDINDTSFFENNDIQVEVVAMDRTGLNPFKDWKYCRSLKAKFRDLNPGHILAYQAKAAVWSGIAARTLTNCRVSILFPGLGYLFAPRPTMRQRLVQLFARRLYTYAFRNVETAIFQNHDDFETMKSFRILNSKTKVAIVNGSGVCLKQFPSTTPATEPVRFAMATRLLSDKGIREFAIAAGELVEKYGSQVEFQIAGGFDSNPAAIKEDEIAEWENKGWLRYCGHVSDMVDYLNNSSVFVLPSYYMEGTPRSILEAMSVGRAIVTTDHRGCRDTVEKGYNGFLVRPRDVKDLKDAMERFVVNPQLILSFGKCSRIMAEQKYDVDLVNQQMLQAMGLSVANRVIPESATNN